MKLSILAATLAATVFCSAADAAQTVRIEDCGKKTDAVVFMVDASGSMMQTVGEIKKKARKQHETLSTSDQGTAQADSAQPPNAEIDDSSRVRLAKEVISKIASQLPPESGIELSLYTIAPYAELVPPAQRTTEEFVRTANERLSTNLEVFGRPTWMGKRAYGKFSAKVDGIERILLVTDGHFDLQSGDKRSAVDGLRAFYDANPKACVHIISAAYTQEEKAGVEELAAVNPCSKILNLETLASNEEVLQGFVEEALYKDCSQVGLIEIEDVNFGFDQAVLTAESADRLDKAVEVLRKRPNEKVTIVGWTDWTGSDAYNLKLSERRAQAVRNYFVSRGLDESLFDVIGKGKSFKHDNATTEGRHKNRRVELRFN